MLSEFGVCVWGVGATVRRGEFVQGHLLQTRKPHDLEVSEQMLAWQSDRRGQRLRCTEGLAGFTVSCTEGPQPSARVRLLLFHEVPY